MSHALPLIVLGLAILPGIDGAAELQTASDVVPAFLRTVASQLGSPDPSIRAAAACEAGRAGIQAGPLIPDLISMLEDATDVPAVPCGTADGFPDTSGMEPFERPRTTPGLEAAKALAGIGQPAVQPLLTALAQSSWVVRVNAARGLGDMGRGVNGGPIVEALLKAIHDEHPQVRKTVGWALGELRDRRAFEAIVGALRDQEWDVRRTAARALGELDDSRSLEPLSQALKDPAPGVRDTAAWALGELDDFRAVDALLPALADSDARVRRNVAWALGEIDDSRSVDRLATVLVKDDHPEVRENAAWALAEIGDARSVDALAASLRDQDWRVRRNAARALGEIGDARAVESLTGALKDEHADVRKTAAWALGEIRN